MSFFDSEMEVKENNVSLNETNVIAWKTLCNNLKVTDDELFKILLNAYKSHCSKSAFQNNSAAVLKQLDYERQVSSHHCDFHYQICGSDQHLLLSAHTCVLEACIGVGFGQYLKLIPQSTSEISEYNSFSAIQLNDKRIFQVPHCFQNIVQYCYTGDFHTVGENVPNITEIQELIKQLFDNPEINIGMNADLNKHKAPKEVTPALKKVKKNTLTKIVTKNKKVTSHTAYEEDYLDFASEGDPCDEDSNDYVPSEDENKSNQTVKEDISSEDSDTNIEILDVKSALNYRKSSTSSYQCTECESVFYTRTQLANHFKINHLKSQPRQSRRKKSCKTLVKVSNNSKKTKVETPIGNCCNQDFSSKFRFGVHILHNHSSVYVNCSDCEDLVLLQDLIPHYQACHDYPFFPQGQSDLASTDYELSKNETYADSCVSTMDQSSTNKMAVPDMFSTTVPSSVAVNLNSNNAQKTVKLFWDKEIKCIGCVKEMSVKNYVDHVVEQHERSQLDNLQCCAETLYRNHRCLYFQCLLCKKAGFEGGMKPVKPYLLLMNHIRHYHLSDSTKDEKVRCDTCGNLIMKYYIKDHKKRHITTIKRRSQKVTCDICGKEVVKNRFSTHHRSHIERYPCRHCSKVFNRKENMLVHERIHTGEKPFVCDICGKGFRQKVELRLHGRKHEKEDATQLKSQEPANYFNENNFYF